MNRDKSNPYFLIFHFLTPCFIHCPKIIGILFFLKKSDSRKLYTSEQPLVFDFNQASHLSAEIVYKERTKSLHIKI